MSGKWAKQFVSFFITFIATLFIEGLVFMCFKYKGSEGHNFAVFFLTNLCTQLLLYISMSSIVALSILLVEILITAVEAFVYSRLLTPKEKGGRYALVANVTSFVLTLPVWFIVKFIIRV